jgi:hypothetical protein
VRGTKRLNSVLERSVDRYAIAVREPVVSFAIPTTAMSSPNIASVMLALRAEAVSHW